MNLEMEISLLLQPYVKVFLIAKDDEEEEVIKTFCLYEYFDFVIVPCE